MKMDKIKFQKRKKTMSTIVTPTQMTKNNLILNLINNKIRKIQKINKATKMS